MLATGSVTSHAQRIRTDAAHVTRPPVTDLPAQPGVYLAFKVILDASLAAVLLALTAPVIALAALATKLSSKGPIIYSQVRMGRFGRPFRIHKIRTMAHDCEKQSGVQWSKPGDPRVTRVGKFQRRTHIDELPQLWNVIRGDMSLVGPRPEPPEFLPELEKAIPHYRERLLVRPGIAGLAQAQLPPDVDIRCVRRKVAYDIYYVHRLNLWLDLRLILCTGLAFLGIPWSMTRKVCALPSEKPVEHAYQIHIDRQRAVKVFQPA